MCSSLLKSHDQIWSSAQFWCRSLIKWSVDYWFPYNKFLMAYTYYICGCRGVSMSWYCVPFVSHVCLNSVSGLTSLSRACPNLQILYLRRCINITDSGVISISENCPFLVELNIGGCPRITDATLISLGQNCRYLRSFNFSKSEVRHHIYFFSLLFLLLSIFVIRKVASHFWGYL